MTRFLSSHAGRGTAGVLLAVLLLGWPPACAYILAVFLLAWATGQFKQAIREAEDAEAIEAAGEILPAVERGAGAGSLPAGARPSLGRDDVGRALAVRRGDARS